MVISSMALIVSHGCLCLREGETEARAKADSRGCGKPPPVSPPASAMSRVALAKRRELTQLSCLQTCVGASGVTWGQVNLPDPKTFSDTCFGSAELKLMNFSLISCSRAGGRGSSPSLTGLTVAYVLHQQPGEDR